MQENNYQEQTEEIKTVYDEQIMTVNDTIYTLEQQLKEIQKNNIIFEQELRKQAELYGVTPEELTINPEFIFKVQDENGTVRKIKRQNEETVKNELSRKKQLRDSLILFRNKKISQIRKKERKR